MSTNGNGGATMDLEPMMNEELKKGHWTAAEDAKLMEHVRIHGEGNWNSVQKNTGLMRCGKSCRLRWANNLRPDLKKGPFSPEEERIIIDLHAKLGNKWDKMASMLPGRTDNEIKNFWNTRTKRRQRLELPIHSQELHEHSTSIHSQHHHHHLDLQQKQPNSPQCSLFLSQKPAYNPSLPFPKTITFSSRFDPPQNYNQNSSFNPNPSLHINNIYFNSNTNFPSLIMGGRITGSVPELPSYQTSPFSNSSLSFNLNDGVFIANNEAKEPQSSGLLDSMLMECRSLVHEGQLNNEDSLGLLDKGKGKMHEEDEKGTNKWMKFPSTINSCDDITSSQSSIGMKPSEKVMEEMNSMDDYLLSLLDNFHSCTPLPEWYRASYRQSSGDVGQVEAQQNDSLAATNETQNVEWGLGFYSYKNNMPNIS